MHVTYSDGLSTTSLISFPSLSILPHSTSPVLDSVHLFCYLFSLASAIFGVPVGALWGHLWVHKWRHQFPLSLSVSVSNSLPVKWEALWALVRFTISIMSKNLETVNLAFDSASMIIIGRRHDRNSSMAGTTWRQEFMVRLWRDVAYWLVPHGLFRLLSGRTQHHQPRSRTTHNELSPTQ